ncbi:MAG: arginine--tRNA ligase [Candidatus Bathyarchaeota archaeon]|nr:MAG: arginine--tRNA ligase [Candidatus Bathyarchaeota archaeon]
MVSISPFKEFRDECETALRDAMKKTYPHISFPHITLDFPPNPEFGELSSSMCFELAKQTAEKPREMADKIAKVIDIPQFPLTQSVEAAGGGYINFHVNLAEFFRLTLESARTLDTEYGYVRADKSRKIVVEHTSVNPVHPIHIGQARNPVLGDAIARILKARGHTVFRHYYIDDVGRQSAVIAYGYEKLGKPKFEEKPDHFIGVIYTITSCIMEVYRLKKAMEQATEENSELQQQLDDWMSVADDLKNKFPKLFTQLLDEINKDEDSESKVNNLIRGYESVDEKAKQLIREVCQLCMEGFKETLNRAKIFYDSWDWESDIVWSGDVVQILDKLKATPYVFQLGDILEFDADKVAKGLNLKQKLGLTENYELPSLTLVRADGTTLYTTRDIAYSLWKFQKAERIINVIGMEQTLSQMQLKLALYALGYAKQAENLIHFAYNLVRLPGYRMSGRRGRYITLDEVLNEAVKRAYDEVCKRSPHLSEEEKRRISNFVGIGAVKYALVEVDQSKPVVFTWDRVLDFEKNSAPYIQYSHARACSILKKASREPTEPDYSLLATPLERNIVLTLARFPEVFVDAAESLRPNAIADFVNALADNFNKFYNALPVIKAEPPELSDARLALVDAARMVFRNSLNLLGIEAPERM